jgi:hypothetical protein
VRTEIKVEAVVSATTFVAGPLAYLAGVASMVDPSGVAQQLCSVMRDLKMAMIAAKVNEDTCTGIIDTVLNTMPVVVKLMTMNVYAHD